MRVLLFGLPLSTHRRLKDESQGWVDAVPAPHIFSSAPTATNEYSPYSEGELRELRGLLAEGFTHVVVPASRDWREVQSRLRFDCRVHIIRLWEPIKDVKWPDLRAHLHAAVLIDQIRVEKLCPVDLRHALLLPPTEFRTPKTTSQYWQTFDAYSEDRIRRAEKLLSVVEKQHRKPDRQGVRCWIDEGNRRYRIDPTRHGRSHADRAEEDSYRFCYAVPPGFHYDVTDDLGRAFSVTIHGKMQSVKHCNITPWGHIRRG